MRTTSLVTDASREISEYLARDEDKLPVIDIMRTLIISAAGFDNFLSFT